MDQEYERYVAKLKAIGHKEGFFQGLESVEKEQYESLAALIAAKWYGFLRVLIEAYCQDVEDKTDDGKLAEKALKNLLNIHAFTAEKFKVDYHVDLNDFIHWDVYASLASLLNRAPSSSSDEMPKNTLNETTLNTKKNVSEGILKKITHPDLIILLDHFKR